MFKKAITWIIVTIAVLILAILYRTYSPDGSIYFPKCPFLKLTGYKCPGCGSQRAIHYLLNLDIVSAVKENLLLVISIPYVLAGFTFDVIKKSGGKFLKLRRILFGRTAILVILFLIIGFWIHRNIPIT